MSHMRAIAMTAASAVAIGAALPQGSDGNPRGTCAIDRRLFGARRQLRPLGNESTRCASTLHRQALWLPLVCRLRGALEGGFSA